MSNYEHEKAFPLAKFADEDGRRGMDLRDYFAAAALTGIVASGDAGIRHEHYGPEMGAAMDAFKIADAMMKERSK